jgi:hypothetical protein
MNEFFKKFQFQEWDACLANYGNEVWPALPAIDLLADDVCANLVISAGRHFELFLGCCHANGGAADQFHRWPLVTGR